MAIRLNLSGLVDVQFVLIRTFVLSSRLITSIIRSVLGQRGRAATLHASGSNLYDINLVYRSTVHPIHHTRDLPGSHNDYSYTQTSFPRGNECGMY